MSIPRRIAINHDDYHARYVGRLTDGRQFFVTQPFVAATDEHPGCEYLAVYVFAADGRLLEARIDDLGPRATLDQGAAAEILGRRLQELGEIAFEAIEVEPFEIERDGVKFGLISTPPEDEDDQWCVILEPGNCMAFYPPWDGNYDT